MLCELHQYAFFNEIHYFQITATYRKHSFETEHPLGIFCKKNYIKRVYSPAASPWYNGVVESTHRLD